VALSTVLREQHAQDLKRRGDNFHGVFVICASRVSVGALSRSAWDSGETEYMKLSQEEVRYVAELAKLSLTEEEVAQYAEQLSDILSYAEMLQEVDTSGIPPTPYVLPLTNVLREDEAGPSLSNAEALANAPDQEDGFFRVRAVFEE
jgi:aspartyl-tRNA(Asn)/glutamyl-tRNA(Gln) amidotransferase subunit C